MATKLRRNHFYRSVKMASMKKVTKIKSENVFEPLTDVELNKLNDCGISLDRLAAHFGRIFEKANREYEARNHLLSATDCRFGVSFTCQ